MTGERETRTQTDIWGTEHEYIYEDGERVGEYKNEDRGGFLGIGTERQRVEYDSDHEEVGYSRAEKRGGFLGIGAEDVEANYDGRGERAGYSRVEERGGFLGIGSHHARIGYAEDGCEISSTQTESRGGFLGIGERRVRVTRYEDDARSARASRSASSSRDDLGDGLGQLVVVLAAICFVVWVVFAVLLPLAIIDTAVLALVAAAVSPKHRQILFSVSTLGAAYMLMDYNSGWLTHSLTQTLPFLGGWISLLVYVNVAAGLASAYFLLAPMVPSLRPGNEGDPTKQQLLLVGGLVALGAAILAAQIYVDVRWQRENTPMSGTASSPAPPGAQAGAAPEEVAAPVQSDQAEPSPLPQPTQLPPQDDGPPAPQSTVTAGETHSAELGTSFAGSVAPVQRPRTKQKRAVVPAAPATIACVLPDGRETKLIAGECESAGGMEYR
jgi:hypothetical protein